MLPLSLLGQLVVCEAVTGTVSAIPKGTTPFRCFAPLVARRVAKTSKCRMSPKRRADGTELMQKCRHWPAVV